MHLAYVQWVNVANEFFYFGDRKWTSLDMGSWAKEEIRADVLLHIRRLFCALVARQAACPDSIRVGLMEDLWFSVSRAFVTRRRGGLLELNRDLYDDDL
jgi:hypothetical protein